MSKATEALDKKFKLMDLKREAHVAAHGAVAYLATLLEYVETERFDLAADWTSKCREALRASDVAAAALSKTTGIGLAPDIVARLAK
ncbi:MAG: hypothetical protein ACTSX8_02855 [Alphaproteobacteria bacterium]